MSEWILKVLNFLLGFGIFAIPVAVYVIFRDPVWTALSAVGAFLLKFAGKVWDRLEPRYVDAVAKWLPPKIESLVTRYRARYRRAIYFQHRSFDVKGLNTQGAFSLELDQVFVELSLSPEAPHKISTDPLRKSIEVGERREIWEFLKNDSYRHLAILGPPGSGKTTLLKHLALALAGPRKKRPLKLTPVLLFLRDLAKANPDVSLVEAIERSLPKRFQAPEGWVKNELESNRCLVLLDGLDEVADAGARRAVAKWVEERMREYGETRFVLTSRPNGYLSNPLDGVTVLDVKPFTWPQVERFVKNWYLATETVRAGKRDTGVELEAEKGAQDLLGRLSGASALTDLAVNPLLLTMITTVHKERNSLPGRRVELYNEICEVFLGKRQASKGLVLDLTPAQKRRVLEPLAWHMMVSKVRKISVGDAHAHLAPALVLVDPKVNAAQFLENVRDDSGLVIEQEIGEYAFAHLTFQEYLASSHAKEAGLEPELVTRVSEIWWMETIRLFAAQNNATRIVEACVGGSPSVETLSLGMDCVEEGLGIRPEVRARVEAVVIDGLESADETRRKLAAEVLLSRYLRSMVRVGEDCYRSNGLVPNAVYELFVRELLWIAPPRGWGNGRFPAGQGRQPVVGVSGTEAIGFRNWLNERYGDNWHFDLPDAAQPWQGDSCWIRSNEVVISDSPQEWLVRAQHALGERIRIEDYCERLRTRARDLARDLDRTLERARARALIRARDINFVLGYTLVNSSAIAMAHGRDIVLDLDSALDPERDVARARALTRALHYSRGLDDVEIYGLSILGLAMPGSADEERYGNIFLAAALEIEQKAGRLPPPPVGIALVRTRKKDAQMAAGA